MADLTIAEVIVETIFTDTDFLTDERFLEAVRGVITEDLDATADQVVETGTFEKAIQNAVEYELTQVDFSDYITSPADEEIEKLASQLEDLQVENEKLYAIIDCQMENMQSLVHECSELRERLDRLEASTLQAVFNQTMSGAKSFMWGIIGRPR